MSTHVLLERLCQQMTVQTQLMSELSATQSKILLEFSAQQDQFLREISSAVKELTFAVRSKVCLQGHLTALAQLPPPTPAGNFAQRIDRRNFDESPLVRAEVLNSTGTIDLTTPTHSEPSNTVSGPTTGSSSVTLSSTTSSMKTVTSTTACIGPSQVTNLPSSIQSEVNTTPPFEPVPNLPRRPPAIRGNYAPPLHYAAYPSLHHIAPGIPQTPTELIRTKTSPKESDDKEKEDEAASDVAEMERALRAHSIEPAPDEGPRILISPAIGDGSANVSQKSQGNFSPLAEWGLSWRSMLPLKFLQL